MERSDSYLQTQVSELVADQMQIQNGISSVKVHCFVVIAFISKDSPKRELNYDPYNYPEPMDTVT